MYYPKAQPLIGSCGALYLRDTVLKGYCTLLHSPPPPLNRDPPLRYPSSRYDHSPLPCGRVWGVADAGQTSDATTPTPYPLTYPHLGRPPSYPPYPPSYPLPRPRQSLDSQGIINRRLMVLCEVDPLHASGVLGR